MKSINLWCGLIGLRYDVESRTGHLDLQGCCDMSGAIHLFQRIDPGVRRITTTNNGQHDTIYRRLPDWQWQAINDGHAYEPCNIKQEAA